MVAFLFNQLFIHPGSRFIKISRHNYRKLAASFRGLRLGTKIRSICHYGGVEYYNIIVSGNWSDFIHIYFIYCHEYLHSGLHYI